MQVLLLGGYRFLGRAIVLAAQARDHMVSAFNRGHLEPMAGVEQITGDRDDLRPLGDHRWDVAIDTSGQIPRHVGAAASELASRVQHYTFVSTLSVYWPPHDPAVEIAAVNTDLAGADPDDAANMDTYGVRKALSERAAEAAMPGRTASIRAGFIIGPHDYSDRFSSWVERAARAEPLIVPGDPDAPVQVIDVNDLAAWIVELAERRLTGTYNATGPEGALTITEMARACIDGTGARSTLVHIPSETLQRAGVEPWGHIPFWCEPEDYGIMRTDIRQALAGGLRLRPLRQTVAETYAWLRDSDHPRRIALPPGLERAALDGATGIRDGAPE